MTEAALFPGPGACFTLGLAANLPWSFVLMGPLFLFVLISVGLLYRNWPPRRVAADEEPAPTVLALRFTVLKDVIYEIAHLLPGKLVVVPSNPVGLGAQGRGNPAVDPNGRFRAGKGRRD